MAGKKRNSPTSVVIKKVSRYPIPGVCKNDSETFKMNILKVSEMGFLANVGEVFLRPLDTFEVSCELPVTRAEIICTVTVVKTYGNLNAESNKKTRLAEFHFKNLKPKDRGAIKAFLAE